MRVVVAMGSLALVLAAGCSRPPPTPTPLCYESHPTPDGGGMRPLRAEEWARLLVRGGSFGSSADADCRGEAIRWTPTDPGCAVREEDGGGPRAVPLSDASVIVGRTTGGGERPVWIITHRFGDGDGFGPVGVAVRDDEGVSIWALGALRLPTERARLRLRQTGGHAVLVADGERCPPEAALSSDAWDPPAEGAERPVCLRSARLMPLVGTSLVNAELRGDGDRCLGPATVELSREERVGLDNGWERRFRLAASMELRGGGVRIHEHVEAHDLDPRDPGRPPRLFRATDDQRSLSIQPGGAMSATGLPLFERVREAAGSTQVDAE